MANKKHFAWLAWVSKAILAGVFLSAAIPKLSDPKAFATVIDAYGLLPTSLLLPAALAISVLEAAGAIGIFPRQTERVGLAIIFGLLLFFILILGYGLQLGLNVDCGCFGKEDPEYKFFSTLKFAFFRDLFLLLPVAYLYVYGRYTIKRKTEVQHEKG